MKPTSVILIAVVAAAVIAVQLAQQAVFIFEHGNPLGQRRLRALCALFRQFELYADHIMQAPTRFAFIDAITCRNFETEMIGQIRHAMTFEAGARERNITHLTIQRGLTAAKIKKHAEKIQGPVY
jgi:hypothetical protein